jgi:hypothetical protein
MLGLDWLASRHDTHALGERYRLNLCKTRCREPRTMLAFGVGTSFVKDVMVYTRAASQATGHPSQASSPPSCFQSSPVPNRIKAGAGPVTAVHRAVAGAHSSMQGGRCPLRQRGLGRWSGGALRWRADHQPGAKQSAETGFQAGCIRSQAMLPPILACLSSSASVVVR